jgi:tetratricopeptide (TPR) repeat protein
LYEESLSIFRDLGDRWGIPGTLNNLGEMAFALGDFDEASARFGESLAIRREIGDRRGVAGQLNNLGRTKCAQGDFAGARELHEESVRILCELGERKVFVEALEGLANVAAGSKDPARAARFWGAAEQQREAIGCPLPPKDLAGYDQRVAAARIQLLDDAAFASAWSEGRAMTLEESQDFALPARAAARESQRAA